MKGALNVVVGGAALRQHGAEMERQRMMAEDREARVFREVLNLSGQLLIARLDLAATRAHMMELERQVNRGTTWANYATRNLREALMLMRTGAAMNVQAYNLIVDAANVLGGDEVDESETDDSD